MKHIWFICFSLMFCFIASGQTDHFTIYKLPKANRSKNVKLNKTFTIGYDLEVSDSMRTWKKTKGKLAQVNDNTLTLQVYNVQTYSELKEYGKLSSSTDILEYSDTLKDAVRISYAIDDIEYLEISRYNEQLEKIGITGAIFSALTTFVIAPLVSIDYQERTFNSNTYRNWALAGTAGMAISFPLLVSSSKTKRYKINDSWPGGGNKKWTTRK
jgi:hypothetical protein